MIRWEQGPYRVVFSTREGGVSTGPYSSLNLGLLTGDERALVEENRGRLLAELPADPARAAWPRQVHGARVITASGRGEEADAIWTDEPGRALLVVTADCLPIALVRTSGEPAVALVHAGRRGLAAGVVEAAVGAVGGQLAAVVGPGIGACCYEVDLRADADRRLGDAGVGRVEHVDLCTACDPERFFSHRRDRGLTGRQGAVAVVA